MHLSQNAPWHKWPVVAGALALAFVIYGISLVSRSHRLQNVIGNDVRLLNELAGLGEQLQRLGEVHRLDVELRNYQWSDALENVRDTHQHIQAAHAEAPGIGEMEIPFERLLHRTDSMHREAMGAGSDQDQVRQAEAIVRILLQRAQRTIDRATRTVHEEGLARHSARSTVHWKEAQVLVIAACMLAVVFAWLVGVSQRLLSESRVHTRQLSAAKAELERTNQDLRETMLSKEEKEMMLKEIHHRVKNNLQIVKSLIRFQMEQVSDPRVTELFNECVNRVSAMALVHEQTYLSKDLANIDVNTYLSHLTRDLCQAYAIDTRLDLDIRIDVPTLGVDTLIPLGLLINEIISNSLKYAFAGRKQGTIFLHLSGGDHGLHLRIGDDGIGLSDRSRWDEPKSLGMELIHTLSDQLDARMDLLQGAGTVYELSSVKMERQRRA